MQMPQNMSVEPTYTVSMLNNEIRLLLETHKNNILLIGEISNFSKPSSGHWYFTLKDERAQVKAAMFRSNNQHLGFIPHDGMQVIMRATVTLYEPRGDYQLVVNKIKPYGEGELQQKFDALKLKLSQEGLFDQKHKKAIPKYAKTVGIITSQTGAALQDILHVLKRRDPTINVIIYPSQVQGNPATKNLIQMVQLANQRKECEVIILARGGGSLEDLWCFNEESLARTIFASQIPIISGVGHETDFTIADFVADMRAPTPSAAAEMVSRNRDDMLQFANRLVQRLEFALDFYLKQQQNDYASLVHRLKYQHPALQISRKQLKLNTLTDRLSNTQNKRINTLSNTVNSFMQRLYQHNPYAIGFNRLTHFTHRLNKLNPILQINQLNQQVNSSVNQLKNVMSQQLDAHLQMMRMLDSKLYPSINQTLNLERVKHNKLMTQFYQLPRLNLFSQHHQRVVNSLYQFNIAHLIQERQHTLSASTMRMKHTISSQLDNSKFMMIRHFDKLDALSPLKNLQRGYAIALTSDKVQLKSQKQVKKGDIIETRVTDGKVISEVIRTESTS